MTSGGGPSTGASAGSNLYGGKSKLIAVIGDEVRWIYFVFVDLFSLSFRIQLPGFYSVELEN